MEEDIKILESFIDKYGWSTAGYNQEVCTSIEKIIKVVQTLINKVKEKDEINSRLLRIIEDSIPKTKIREKIEEINGNRQYLSQFKDWEEKDYTNEDIINNCVEVLQELLEDK